MYQEGYSIQRQISTRFSYILILISLLGAPGLHITVAP